MFRQINALVCETQETNKQDFGNPKIFLSLSKSIGLILYLVFCHCHSHSHSHSHSAYQQCLPSSSVQTLQKHYDCDYNCDFDKKNEIHVSSKEGIFFVILGW